MYYLIHTFNANNERTYDLWEWNEKGEDILIYTFTNIIQAEIELDRFNGDGR